MKRVAFVSALALLFAATTAHATGRLADVTITDRTTGRTLPVYWHHGQAYVAGTPGHEYGVTLRNRQREDLMAVMSVDGVNVLSGETASASQSGYVLSAWGRFEIQGWRKSMDETASFYFTSLGDSYAARTDRPDNVGVIGVALFRRAAPPPPVAEIAPAPYERDFAARREQAAPSANATAQDKSLAAPATPATAPPARSESPLGTGHGRREESHVRYVEFERATSSPAETIVIRYDSYPNLVALGVIPTYGRRDEPRPFPGAFVPDPR